MTSPEHGSGGSENADEAILKQGVERYGEGAEFFFMKGSVSYMMTLEKAMMYCKYIALASEAERWSELDVMFKKAEIIKRRRIQREMAERAIDA